MDRDSTTLASQQLPANESPRIMTVKEGVFFTTPAALPRGRHVLQRGDVLAAQRERLMIAVTELVAANGYRGVGVREIASRARVSRAAFYEVFTDKDECIFAAYDRFIAVLVTKVLGVASDNDSWEATLSSAVKSYLVTLASDVVTARAFQVEMDALGRPARERRRQALTGLAALLQERRTRLAPHAPPLPASAYIGGVYAVRQLVSDELDLVASAESDIHLKVEDLHSQLLQWLTPLFTTASPPAPLAGSSS